MTELLPRHEVWRRTYRSDPYMHGLTDAEVELRFADVMTNQLILTEEGKIGIVGTLWLEKFTHLDEELKVRGKGFPHPARLDGRLGVPKPGVSALSEMVRKQVGGAVPSKFMLFKYGKREHLEPLHREGQLRLCPASFYSDPSLNLAVADSELSFEKIRGTVRTRYIQRRDFYCFCTSWLHSHRLVADFDATAVLVVTNPHDFFLRLARALNEPTFEIHFNRVKYVDPLLLDDHEIADLRFLKHMRFTYQTEHRWVATPPAGSTSIGVRNLSLGSLEDISVLH